MKKVIIILSILIVGYFLLSYVLPKIISIPLAAYHSYQAKNYINEAVQNEEVELLNRLDFNIQLMNELKKETENKLVQLPAIDQETADILDEYYNGIHSQVSEEKANSVVKKLKEKFRNQGYLIFAFTGEEDAKSIGVIKGTNELDILRYRRTDGINHDYENEDIVSKIFEWKNKYGLTVIGCGRDWLEIEFKTMPKDLENFVNEVYEFCPDVVDQGVGSVENLREAIKQMHGIWLWWD